MPSDLLSITLDPVSKRLILIEHFGNKAMPVVFLESFQILKALFPMHGRLCSSVFEHCLRKPVLEFGILGRSGFTLGRLRGRLRGRLCGLCGTCHLGWCYLLRGGARGHSSSRRLCHYRSIMHCWLFTSCPGAFGAFRTSCPVVKNGLLVACTISIVNPAKIVKKSERALNLLMQKNQNT